MNEALTKALTTKFRALKQAKFRKLENLFMLEGVRLCEEALRSNLKITACILEKSFKSIPIPDEVDVYEANHTQLEQIADSKSPQGIICIAEIPAFQPLPIPMTHSLVLALDRISDPGNLGTILRSALWFGVRSVVLGPGCVDPYSPKAVRASMGALSHLSLHESLDLVTACLDWTSAGGQTAALHMSGEPIHSSSRTKGLCLIVGSEAHGVHPDLLAASQALSIPKVGRGESLNAAMATAIALYELTKPEGVA